MIAENFRLVPVGEFVTSVPPTVEELEAAKRYAQEHIQESFAVPEWKDGVSVTPPRITGAPYVRYMAYVDREANQTTVTRWAEHEQSLVEEPRVIDVLKTAVRGLGQALFHNKPKEKTTEDLADDLGGNVILMKPGDIYLIATPIKEETKKAPPKQLVRRILFWPEGPNVPAST